MNAPRQEFERGQTVPFDYSRRPFGADCDPAWYVFTTRPQKEWPAQCWLEGQGAAEVWFPTTKEWRQVGRSGRKVPYLRKVAPGYLFVLAARAIAWDLLFDWSLGRLTGVIGTAAGPMPIRPRDLAEMQHVPDRLVAEREAILAERRAEAEAARPAANCEARVLAGSFRDVIVHVDRLEGPIAHVLASIFGRPTPMEVPVADLRRLPDVEGRATPATNSGE